MLRVHGRSRSVRSAAVVIAVTGLLAACGTGGGGTAATVGTPRPASTARSTVGTPTPETTTSPKAPAVAASWKLSAVTLQVPAANRTGAFTTTHTVNVPKGWKAEVWAIVPNARMEAWTPRGDLLVSVPSSGTVLELVPGKNAATPPTQHVILSGLDGPQGLAFAKVDGHEVLYVGEYDRIDRYAWNGTGVSGSPLVLASGYTITSGYAHPAKDVAVGSNGTVYFNVGSATNADPADRSAHPAEAVVMAVQPNGKGLHVVAKGVRNGEGLAFAPDGVLWAAINQRDQIPYPFHTPYDGIKDPYGQVITAYVNDHPPDEVASITRGRDLGWPYCNPDQDVNKPAGSLANPPFVADAVANPGQKDFDCNKLQRIQVGLPAHSAPLGFTFLEGSKLGAPWNEGAVVAVHGSWDRSPPRAPAVLWMRWDATTKSLEPAVDLITGFQYSNGNRWGRVVDAVAGPNGDLYVSDDTAGAIYRIVPTR